MTKFNDKGVITWDYYYGWKVKPVEDKLNSVDVILMKLIHGLWAEDNYFIPHEAIKDAVHEDGGHIDDDELRMRLDKLKKVGLLKSAVMIN